MRVEEVECNGRLMTVYSLNTVVVGSGAAGLNAADRLHGFGQTDIAVVTEGLNMGTSRNTGSDKQTYYKLTLAGSEPDSVLEMAQTLYSGGCMHGDIALVEAALSARCFYRLAEIGVPFPHDRYGQYVGYKTDHDPRQRAASAGPLTSKFMTDMLQQQVQQKGIPIFDGYQVIKILTDDTKTRSIGLLALNLNEIEDPARRYIVFNCTNIIYATGGPAGLYAASVYPESQVGATGIAFEAGVKGQNLTESQYGIASVKFRWNLSGTYQQVLPRYVSTDPGGGDEREFLNEYFETPGKMLDAIFLKGYQWPFDPRKVQNQGSSLIDILVYNETVNKGRRVFLDFMHNPTWGSRDGELDFSLLGEESFGYLQRSGALFGRPIDRLAHMNQPAIELYRDHGIDLTKEYLEIAVCAQHNNGGLCGNIWWESNLQHFFPVGEVNGSHGVYRPGGSALNSGQVGSTRAAQFIATCYRDQAPAVDVFLSQAESQIGEVLDLERGFLHALGEISTVAELRNRIGQLMTRTGAHIRSQQAVRQGAEEARHLLETLTDHIRLCSIKELSQAFRIRDLLITQYVYLSAIDDYIEHGGRSRGSYLVYDPTGYLPLDGLPEMFRFALDDGQLSTQIQQVSYRDGRCQFEWIPVRPIPDEDGWFETIWNAYRRGEIVK